MATSIDDLFSVIDQLNEKDQEFASSLVTNARKYGGFTQKQQYWADRLFNRAQGLEPSEPKTEQLAGDLKPMMVMLQFAGQHLKHPKVRLLMPSAKQELDEHPKQEISADWIRRHTVKLAVAGDRSKYKGQVQVTDEFPFGSNVWYGRVDKDGKWTHPMREPELISEVGEALQEFSADPVQAATAYGKLMGYCCFCNRKLTDKRSTDVGYGPDCAAHYNMPWGGKD